MIICIASGKGGTGKTTVATNLAWAIATDKAMSRREVVFLDCDAEEPNAALFLRPILEHHEEVGILIPQVDLSKCTYCGRCAEVCVWHALAVVGKKVLVFPELCHGCGSCTLNCPEQAIHERLYTLGRLESGWAGPILFGQGTLDVGQAMSTPLIRQLKKKHLAGQGGAHLGHNQVVILDASPGTSCPVVEAMRGADLVLLVTEPTPFGLHDLRLAVQVARDELGLPVGVVVNRDGIGDASVDEYCASQGVPILMRIPHDRHIAEAYSDGVMLLQAQPSYGGLFMQLYDRITGLVERRSSSPGRLAVAGNGVQ